MTKRKSHEGKTRPRPSRESMKRRKRSLMQSSGRCAHCGATEDLTLDHKVPRSKGGADTLDNLQLLCWTCNHAKDDREAAA